MTRMVGLLRAVNVGGRKLVMSDLRALASDLGWQDVATYIQSGNLVFTASGKSADLERSLEEKIEGATGMKVPVIVRSARQWAAYVTQAPFPSARGEEPNRLILLLSKSPPTGDAARSLQARAQAGEMIGQGGDAVWIHYPAGVANSKLTPAVIDRAMGSPATGRNFRTVLKLQEMLGQ